MGNLDVKVLNAFPLARGFCCSQTIVVGRNQTELKKLEIDGQAESRTGRCLIVDK
jgi:hypothetical protein